MEDRDNPTTSLMSKGLVKKNGLHNSVGRKHKFMMMFLLITVSIIVMLIYSEFKLQIYNPNARVYQDPIFVSKHLLDTKRDNDIVVFLWDPVSEDSDWTAILKSNYLMTESQFKELKKLKSNRINNNLNDIKQLKQIQHQDDDNNNNNSNDDDDDDDDIIEINKNNICSVSCKFTNVQEELVESHLVLFDPHYLEKENWKRIPLHLPEKHPHQKFGLMHYKTKSEYSILKNQNYKNLMDLQISYYNSTFKDLDITLACPPNSSYSIKDTENLLLLKHSTDDFDKRNSIVFISSNCNDGLSAIRTKLVEYLSKHLEIDSFGRCLKNKNLTIDGRDNSNDIFKSKSQLKNLYERIEYNMNIYKNYKFVICFESDNSTNYITEKVYTALYAGAIPIYMGSNEIINWVPKNSIINLNDFKNIDQVLLYIKDIIDGKVQVNRFFEWKDYGKLEDNVIDKLERCINSINIKCKICEMLNSQLTKVDKEYRLSTMSLENSISYYTPLYIEFKGLGDHIVVQQDNSKSCKGSLDLSDHYTLMVWVRPSTFGDQRIIDKNKPGKIDGFNFDIQKTSTGRGIVRLCAGDNCYESHNSISNDLWYHIAVVFDCNNNDVQKNRIKFYINGNLDAVYDNFSPTKKNSHPLVIGKSGIGSDGHSFHGKLDNIMIFNSSLTHDDIKQLIWDKPTLDYNITGFNGQSIKPSINQDKLKRFKIYKNLVLYYDFDNNPLNDKTNRLFIADQSNCNNNGKLSKGLTEEYPEKHAAISKEFSFNRFL